MEKEYTSKDKLDILEKSDSCCSECDLAKINNPHDRWLHGFTTVAWMLFLLMMSIFADIQITKYYDYDLKRVTLIYPTSIKVDTCYVAKGDGKTF